MKKQFILFCMMLVALAPVCFAQPSPAKQAKSASSEKAITDLEKSAWESYKNKQADAFKKLMSQDYCGAYADALKTLDMEVADMAKADLRDYSLADMKVVFPSADVAVTRYKATIQQTSEGKDMSGTYNSASVWVKKRVLVCTAAFVFQQDTPLPRVERHDDVGPPARQSVVQLSQCAVDRDNDCRWNVLPCPSLWVTSLHDGDTLPGHAGCRVKRPLPLDPQ